MTKRIYAVEEKDLPGKLVRAGSQAQAIAHVVRGRFTATVATPEQVVSLLTLGVKVEDAANGEPA